MKSGPFHLSHSKHWKLCYWGILSISSTNLFARLWRILQFTAVLHRRLSSVIVIPLGWRLSWLATARRYLQVWWNTRGPFEEAKRYFPKISRNCEISRKRFTISMLHIHWRGLSLASLRSMPNVRQYKNYNIQFWNFTRFYDHTFFSETEPCYLWKR